MKIIAQYLPHVKTYKRFFCVYTHFYFAILVVSKNLHPKIGIYTLKIYTRYTP